MSGFPSTWLSDALSPMCRRSLGRLREPKVLIGCIHLRLGRFAYSDIGESEFRESTRLSELLFPYFRMCDTHRVCLACRTSHIFIMRHASITRYIFIAIGHTSNPFHYPPHIIHHLSNHDITKIYSRISSLNMHFMSICTAIKPG